MSVPINKPSHIYTSGKGDNFLSWDDWMMVNATDAEKEAYLDPSDTNEVKNGAYHRWIEAEQILTHVQVDSNGNTIYSETF